MDDIGGLTGVADQPSERPEVLARITEANDTHDGLNVNLSQLSLTFIPSEVKMMRSLRILNLRGNFLTMMPTELCHCLRQLEVGGRRAKPAARPHCI
jgi:hypothetical protein